VIPDTESVPEALMAVDELIVLMFPVVELRVVIVPDAETRSDIDVVARLELPSTVSVPFEVRDEVAVIEPPVIDENIAVIPEIRLVKKLVEVALSKNALRAKRLVVVLLVEDELRAIKLLLTVVLVVVRLAIVPVDEVN
jgi:hypothetical protein